MILHAWACELMLRMCPQVRDLLTTEHEQQLNKTGQPGPASSLSRDAITVDAIVSTIGFPLVGGPAGTMEGGRQADVAKAILTAKNVPYVVAAPLLIQARLYPLLMLKHVAAVCVPVAQLQVSATLSSRLTACKDERALMWHCEFVWQCL